MNRLDQLKQRSQAFRGSFAADTATTEGGQTPAPSPPPQPKPNNRLQEKLDLARSEEGEWAQYAEIKRICRLPLVGPMDELEQEEYQRMNVQAHRYEAGFRLFGVQAETICAYEQFGGVFGAIGVGWGKTLCTLAIASKAFAKGHQRMMLLVPSQVLPQLVKTDIPWARNRVSINYPIHVLGGKTIGQRRALARSGKRGLYILPYSLLSTRDSVELLDLIQPRIIIADECHHLARRNAARTRRFMEYVDKHKPEGVCLSGTITSKSIKDYYHLIKWCLGQNNPLPNAAALANEWAQVIDADAVSDGTWGSTATGQRGPLMPLVRWAREFYPSLSLGDDQAGFRRAYQCRLNTAPGVIVTGDAEIGTSLMMHNAPVPEDEAQNTEGWQQLDHLSRQVTEEWLTPNLDEIEHAIHCWKWLFELSAGFYNELTWPTPEAYAERKQISEDRAEDLIERAKVHHEAGQVYAKALRDWLDDNAKPHMDTPLLVGQEMARNGELNVGSELYQAWCDWKALDFDERPERDSRAVRVCPFKLNAAVRWALEAVPKKAGAILWVYHQEVGKWLTELLQEAGIDALHCPAGDAHNSRILDPANARRKIVASISAHGTGKNLQHFQHQYYVQWPRQATMAEQSLGRTHRNGQTADELTVWMNHSLEFDEVNFAACLNDALYIQQTTGNRQKLIYANYEPLPRVFPSAVLHERGLQNKILTSEQERMMRDKFGGETR